MATTKKGGRGRRRAGSRRSSGSTRRSAERTSTSGSLSLGGVQSHSQGRYPSQSVEGGEESEVTGQILGAGQGGPSRSEYVDLGGGPSRHSEQGTQSQQAKHNEGLAGGEGLGSDDKVIDSSFSLSGRKRSSRKAQSRKSSERAIKGSSDIEQGRDVPFSSRESMSGGESMEEESDVDISPGSVSGRSSGMEGHGRGMSAPGAGA